MNEHDRIRGVALRSSHRCRAMTPAQEIGPWVQGHFLKIWLLSWGSGVIVAALSAWRRHRRGLPIFRPWLAGALFEDRWCSGGRGLLRVRNCAWISLLPQRVVTGLHFPFHLFFPHRWLAWAGLDNDIDVRDIVSADKSSSFGSELVRITYRTATGTGSFQMLVTDADRMLRLLAQTRRP